MVWLLLIGFVVTLLGLWTLISWAVGHVDERYGDYELEPNKQNDEAMIQTIHEIKAEAKARMIKKLFALGYRRDFDKLWHQDERVLTPSQRVAKHLNQWFTEHKESPVKKVFQNMTGKELQMAVTVFDKIEHWHLDQINKTKL